jgi:hypothetical protein
MRYLTQPLYRDEYTLRERVGILTRFAVRGVLPGGPVRWFHFLRSVAGVRPAGWPQVVSDWVGGLALRAYAERYLTTVAGRKMPTADAIGARRSQTLGGDGFAVSIATTAGGSPQVTVTLRSGVGSRILSRTGRQIERLLRSSTATLVLRVETLAASERGLVQQWLQRMARYGDRVSVRASADLRRYLGVDSSVFHLVLEES